MTVKIARVFILLWILFIPVQRAYSQQRESRNNYTGAWEIPASWSPLWPVPLYDIKILDILIYGYITTDDSLTFSWTSDLRIRDTLVINGSLSLADHSDLIIYDGAILIIRGDLYLDKHAEIIADGYLIITGSIYKRGPWGEGSLTSNDNPVHVFVGGTIPPELTNDNHKYPALDCTSPPTTPYPDSDCSYGNMTDLENDAIFTFFQSTCAVATPTISTGGLTTFCAGESVTLTSSAGTTYLWSTGATTQTINVTTAGSFTVKVTNSAGCLSIPSTPEIVTVNALPAIPVITAGGPTTFCTGGNVVLTSSPATSYLWSTGETTAFISISESGNYSVKINNAAGCQSAWSVPALITVNTLPETPVITSSGPLTFCSGGNVTLTSSVGTTYLWSTGATASSINTTTVGSYTIRVIDVNGCQSALSGAAVVIVNSLPVVDAGPDISIPNGTSTIINASVGGSDLYTYNWSPTDKLINSSIEDPVTLNLAITTIFTFTATSSTTSCSANSSVTITITGGPLNSLPEALPGIVCAGSEVKLYSVASGGSGTYTYSWTSIPAGFSSSSNNPVVNPLVTTTYYLAVYDGYSTFNSQVAVTVNDIPAAPEIISSGSTSFCNGGNVDLYAGPGEGYLWSNGAATSSINVSETGIYIVTLTNLNGCTSLESVPVNVTEYPVPVTPVIIAVGPTTICSDDSVTLTSSEATSYLWPNGTTTRSINVKLAGSYAVQITNPNGCKSVLSVPVIVTVNSIPGIPSVSLSGPATFCAGDSVTLRSSSERTFLWSDSETTQFITVKSSGSYTVQVTNEYGCHSASSSELVVLVNEIPPKPSITAGGSIIICEGDSVILTSDGNNGFLWSSEETTSSIVVKNPESYYVQTINSHGCISLFSEAIGVSVNYLPATPSISASGPAIFCEGEDISLTSTAESSYLWSNGATSESINVSSSGNYSVKVINSSGCISASSSAQIVTVNELPAAPVVSADGPVTFCDGGGVTLICSPGEDYLWSTGEISYSINITTEGTYTIRVADSNGCLSPVSVETIIKVNSLPSVPVISAEGPTTFCTGGSVTLSSGSESTYLWSTGAVTSDINISESGNYYVRVTDLNGCQSPESAVMVVNVNILPEPPVISTDGPATFCTGGSVNLTSSVGASYLWSTGAVSGSINVNSSGSYSVKVTNPSGCLSSFSSAQIVTVNELPATPEISADGPFNFCDGSSVTLTCGQAAAYLWSDGSTISKLLCTKSGNFTVKVMSSTGCQSENSVAQIVIVDEIPVAIAGSDQELTYITDTQLAADLLSFFIGEWTLISGSGIIADIHSPTTKISKLAIGENRFLWKVKNGTCESADEVIITLSELFIPSVITPDGDGANDYFKIHEMPGKIELIIFNRWGNVEYRNSNYLNDWEGLNMRGAQLPGETYFYVLNFDNYLTRKGSVLIKR